MMVVVLHLSSLSQMPAATTNNEIPDARITAAIENSVTLDKGVLPNDVDVETSQGIVTLSGSVDNLLAKERAVIIAQSVRGVLGVIDRITVTPVVRPDREVRKDILTALMDDPATQSYQVSVFVKDAVVMLTGSVGSYMEKQLAGLIARGVRGVKQVNNELTINYRVSRTDTEIAADVNERFSWDIWINNDALHALVKNGIVVVSGSVGSATGKARAFNDAWVNGVVSVDDSGVAIEPGSHNSMRKTSSIATTPGTMKEAVESVLGLDPRVSAFTPQVSVEGGIVILRGTVGNIKAKTSAEQDVQSIAGVEGVKNFLKVRPAGRHADGEIKDHVKAALVRDPMLDGSFIDVTVVNRVVNLVGTVGSYFQKAEAYDNASRIKGVVLVRNHLHVEQEESVCYFDWPDYPFFGGSYQTRPLNCVVMAPRLEPYLDDEKIKNNVEDGLLLSPYLDVNTIQVVVNDGIVTLTGTVKSWIGWNEADKVARSSGSREVMNRIKIKDFHQ
jgi:osmotically-inducible protein OsmY